MKDKTTLYLILRYYDEVINSILGVDSILTYPHNQLYSPVVTHHKTACITFMLASWILAFNLSMASVAIFCGIAAMTSSLVGRFTTASDDNIHVLLPTQYQQILKLFIVGYTA